MAEVVLFVNGLQYTGWQSVRIHQNIQAVSSEFALTVSAFNGVGRDRALTQALAIHPGDACVIELAGRRLITGYVDTVSPSLSASQHTIRISGRDKTGDLVDCSILNGPYEFTRLPLDRIVSRLCEPFGIGVIVETGVGEPIDVFSIQPSETVWEAIERASRLRGVLITANGLGDVLITQRNNARSESALIQGKNILSASATYSHRDRFSEYHVLATTPWADGLSSRQANAIEGCARDQNILRFRPKRIQSEAASSTAQAQRRVQWEASVRAARSGNIQITTPGWTQRNGEPWKVNTLVPVKSESLSLASDCLITGVTFSKNDQQGSLTQLALMRKDAFESMPTLPAQTDPWFGSTTS